jgi:small subunit ribosomal protein S1
LNEDFVLATADTPDSQAETTKVDQPVEQNNDASVSSGEATSSSDEATSAAVAAPEVVAESTPVAEAPVVAEPAAEATPAVAEPVAEVSETVNEDVAPEDSAPAAEATPAVAEPVAEVSETVNEDVAPEDSAPAAEATAEVVEPAAEAATETASEEAPADAEADTEVAVAEKPESEMTMADLLDEYLPSKVLRRGEIIDGKVMSRKAEGMLVDIGYKSEGFVPTKEMRSLISDTSDEPKIGDEIIAYVVNPEGSEGSSILSIDRARGEQGWRVLEKAMDNNESCKGVITGSNRGGAVVESEGVQGFVPLSQLVGPARELYVPGGEPPKEGFIGMEVEFKIIELNRRRNRAIFSERAALQAWKQIQKMRLVQELTEGEIRKGRVAGISNFGAFVDLGGADGLIHISELSWEPVKSPDEIVTVGTEIDVFVLRVDRENLKIALSLRRLQPEPWDEIETKFSVGQTVTGTVTKLANFGAFARIDRGIEGLIHISELAHQVIKHPRDVVNEGDELELKIIRIEPERRRLGLSLKQTLDSSEEVVVAEEPEALEDIGDFGDIFEDNE